MNAQEFANHVKGKLIVSCPSLEDEPLHGLVVTEKKAPVAKIGGVYCVASMLFSYNGYRLKCDTPILIY